MRISDWSSDVCSSDLSAGQAMAASAVTGSAPPARDDVGFVEEPEPAAPVENVARRLQIGTVADHALQPLILDLGDVGSRVPCRQQGRGADAGEIGRAACREKVGKSV